MRPASFAAWPTFVLAVLVVYSLSGCVEGNSNSPEGADAHEDSSDQDPTQASDAPNPRDEPPPRLAMVSDAAASSTSHWTVKVTDASRAASITEFQFVLTTPQLGTLVAEANTPSFTHGPNECWFVPRGDQSRKESAACEGGPEFKITWSDMDGDSRLSIGDTIQFDYEAENGHSDYASSFPSGSYTLELLHKPSEKSAGRLPRTF